jgi:hypothetical protein
MSWASDLFFSILDPLWILGQLFGFVNWLVELLLADSSVEVKDAFNDWSTLLTSGFISDFIHASMYFIGLGVNQEVFIACVKVNWSCFMVMACVKLILKIVSFFWAGGGA